MKRGLLDSTRLLATALALATFAPSPGAVALGASAPSGPSTVEVPPNVAGLTAAVRHADPATQARVRGWMDQLEAGWTPNLGQIADASRGVSSEVLFSTAVGNAQVFVTTHGISHYFLAPVEDEAATMPTHPARKNRLRERRTEWCRLDVALDGARIRADRVVLEEPVTGQGGTNYYLPHCPAGVRDVPTYGKVTFRDVYPGIDWVVRHAAGDGVHHDFVVHPGADPARIRMRYAGQSAIELSDDRRSLRIRTPLGEVREGALACSQPGGRVAVGARFRVDGDAVSIELDAYDRKAPLVIDPPLIWGTYYGGTSWDGPRAIYCDNLNDDVYVVGYTASTNMPTQASGSQYFQGFAGTLQDAFIWKFTQAGKRLWATYYGGSGIEYNADCTVDASGNLYVCGYTNSTDFPTDPLGAPAFDQAANGGSNDGFILKFDSTGTRLWATYYGKAGSEYLNGITTDASGKVYVCGATTSTTLNLPNPGGGAYYQPTPNSDIDALILRFSATGVLEWGTCFGGTYVGYMDDEHALGIATSTSHVYVTGFTKAVTNFPAFDPGGGAYFVGIPPDTVNGFIARFTLAGVQTWTTYYGGMGNDYADQPAVDASGNLFVFGDTDAADFQTLDPGGSAYYQPAIGGESDFFLLKFNSANVRIWATYYGGNDLEYTGGSDRPLALDPQGNVYVTGMTNSTNLPVQNPGPGSFYQGTPGGVRDALIGQFSNGGAMLWSTYLRSSQPDFGTGVAIGTDNCLFATGESNFTNNFVTMNPGDSAWYQPANAGGDDGYIVRFCPANAACCLDFTCVPAYSQNQCFAMGGIAFYPNQPCSTTVCTINCTICGTKFNDLNRNGVQDGGDPGLAGWTIQLLYPNGSVHATTTTNGSGDYCFTDIPCGPWKVNEVMQPGWVQTFPSPNVHSLSLGTGTTQNNVDFGNYACPAIQNCPPAPPKQVAWWPFDHELGSAVTRDVLHLDPPRNVAQLHLDAMSVQSPGVLCLMSSSDHAVVPDAGQLGLEFAAGSFSIAAWLNAASSSAGARTIVEKRIRLSGSTQTRGWALSLDGLRAQLEIGNGADTQVVPGPELPAETWSHLAVSIDRSSHEGRWYLDGAPVSTFDFVPLDGQVSSNADLYLGQASPAFGTSPAFQGCIGDLTLSGAPMTAADAAKAAGTGLPSWCPEYALLPQVTSICQSQATVQVCFKICNQSGMNAAPQTYQWSLAGLPAGPGCSVAGPTLFSPSSGTVTVASGGCSPPICVTITRPAGFTAQNATSCFQLTFINTATGVCRSKIGTLRADNSCWCVVQAQPSVLGIVPGSAGATIGIAVDHPCDPPALLSYRLTPKWLDPDHADPLALSLDGLPPGTPVTGSINSGRGGQQFVSVVASFPNGDEPAARYEVVMEADTDGNGEMEVLCGTVVAPAGYDSADVVGVPALVPSEPFRLLTSPNPFVGGTTIGLVLQQSEQTSLGIHDLGGRLMRTLQRGRLAAGPHRFEWNGRDDGGRRVPAGIYFVNFDGPGRRLRAKLVKMQ